MQTADVMRRRRLELGLSQTELAAAVGLDVRQIGRYESGRSQPSLQAARAIADKLGITIDELAGGPDNLSGTWWSWWESRADGAIFSGPVQLIHRGQHLEATPTAPGSSGQPGKLRWRSELRILDDGILGWYVIEDPANTPPGTITLYQRDDHLEGMWLTASLRTGLKSGYVVLDRTQDRGEQIITALIEQRSARHNPGP